jgi:CHAT domain-containing protein
VTAGDVVRRLLELDDEGGRRAVLEQCLGAVGCDELLSLLKSESLRYLTIDTRRALWLAEALIHGAGLSGRPDHTALGLMAKGDALRNLGQFGEALTLLDEAGRAFLELRDEVGWARTRIGWVVSSHLLGRGAEALAAAESAYRVFARHEDALRMGAIDLNTAYVCRDLGRYEEALRLYDRAECAYASLGEAGATRAAWAQASRAMVLTLLGEFEAALALHEAARDVFVRSGDTLSVLRQEHYIAQVQASQGSYTRALRRLDDACAAFERAGMSADAAWVRLDMVECKLRLNRYAEALELAEEAIGAFERCGTPTEAARARFYCALASARLGDAPRALDLLAEAAATFARTGLTGQVGLATLQRAGLYLDEADWPSAAAEAARARALFAERGLVVRRAQAEVLRARALLALGQPDEARELAASALAITEGRGVLWLAHESHHVQADIARAAGEDERALDEYEAAIASIERLQSRLATELRTHFLADKLRVYQDAIECCLRLGQTERAFGYLERAKSRALVDYLTSNPDVRIRASTPDVQAIVDELAELRAEHDWFYERLYGYGLARRDERRSEDSEGETRFLQAAVSDRERRIARLLERLALHNADGLEELPRAADRQRPLPPSLDDGTVLLEYYLPEERGWVFVLRHGALTVVPLPVGAAAVRHLRSLGLINVHATAAALAARGSIDGQSRNAHGLLESLYRALLEPVAAHLDGCERVVVVPYGPMHGVPFHALHDGRRYLLERLEVVVCPSSSLLRLCADRARRSGPAGRALVLAFSDGGRLPGVLDEARAVSALLPGACYVEAEATRARLCEAPGHAVVHLAAHGEARLDNPTFAHLKLADGQLGVADVFNLRLDGALVTLSACEMGQNQVAGGDELIGLSRGFLYAGASTLIQSSWRVEDRSTSHLMTQFYRALSAGRPKGAALREAQLALLAGGAPPYIWGAFQLIGDFGPLHGRAAGREEVANGGERW